MEDQAILEEVMAEMMDKEREITRQQNDEALGQLMDAGMEVRYPDKSAFIEAAKEIREEYGAEYADLLQQVESLA